MNDENENCVKTTIVKQCSWVRTHVSTFDSLVNNYQPVTNIVFTTNFHNLSYYFGHDEKSKRVRWSIPS